MKKIMITSETKKEIPRSIQILLLNLYNALQYHEEIESFIIDYNSDKTIISITYIIPKKQLNYSISLNSDIQLQNTPLNLFIINNNDIQILTTANELHDILTQI